MGGEKIHSFQTYQDFETLGTGKPVYRSGVWLWIQQWRIYTLGTILETWEEISFNVVVFTIIFWLLYRIVRLFL